MKLLLRKYNSVTLSTMSLLAGIVSRLGMAVSLSLLLSTTSPEYATYTVTIAESTFIFSLYFLRILASSNIKFSKIVAFIFGIIIVCYSSIATVMQLSMVSMAVIVIAWYSLAAFVDAMTGFLLSKLTLKYLNPAAAQVQFFHNNFAYGIGSLLVPVIYAVVTHVAGRGAPLAFLCIIIALYAVMLVISVVVLCQKTNIEVSFSKKSTEKKDPLAKRPDFKQMLLWLCAIIFLVGVGEKLMKYSVNLYLTDTLVAYEKISQAIIVANLVGTILQIVVNSMLASYQEKYRGSPVNMMLLHCAAMVILGISCLVFLSFPAFMVLFILLIVSQGTFRLSAVQMIASSFPDKIQYRLTYFMNISTLMVSGVAVSVFIKVLTSMDMAHNSLLYTGIVAAIVVAVLAIGALLLYRYKLIGVLYKNIVSPSKESAVRAIAALSFLHPKDYVPQMLSLWQSHPKKLIHKAIILNASYRANIIKELYEEFDANSEEIQFASLKAASVYKQLENLEFFIEIVLGKRKIRSFFVRAEATKILAKYYGKHALPILVYGLKDGDERVQANILEAFLVIKDKSLIQIIKQYIHATTPRIRANAFMALASFRSEKEIYRQGIRDMLSSGDNSLMASSLYVIGKLRDKHFHGQVKALLGNECQDNPMMKRNIAFALSRLHDKQGYELFCDLFRTPYATGKQEDFIHLFSQLDQIEHFSVLEQMHIQYAGNAELIRNTYLHLKNSRFDFHEEIDYLSTFYLNKGDERLKANILEALTVFKNKSLVRIIRPFINSPIPRVRANALLALASFKSEQELYRQGIREMLSSQDENLIASSLYTIGELRDIYFYEDIKKYLGTEAYRSTIVQRNLAFALSRLGDEKGFGLFRELFSIPYVSGKQMDFIHSFSLLEEKERLGFLNDIVRICRGDKAFINNIYSHLKNSNVSFHREIEYLEGVR